MCAFEHLQSFIRPSTAQSFVLLAVAKKKSKAKNLGWAKTIASELEFYGIKVEQLLDRDGYRKTLHGIFHPNKEEEGTDTEGDPK